MIVQFVLGSLFLTIQRATFHTMPCQTNTFFQTCVHLCIVEQPHFSRHEVAKTDRKLEAICQTAFSLTECLDFVSVFPWLCKSTINVYHSELQSSAELWQAEEAALE